MLTVLAVGFPVLAVAILGTLGELLHRFPALERRIFRVMRF